MMFNADFTLWIETQFFFVMTHFSRAMAEALTIGVVNVVGSSIAREPSTRTLTEIMQTEACFSRGFTLMWLKQ